MTLAGLLFTCIAVLCFVRVSAFHALSASVPSARLRRSAWMTMSDRTSTASLSLPRPVRNEELERKARAYFATGNKVCVRDCA
jgi:hypothetical protein